MRNLSPTAAAVKLTYEKTADDSAREARDLVQSPIMRFIKNQSHFKFNIGDVLIKQKRNHIKDEWKTELISGVNTARKFMYVFENELGIGYIKQLRADGSGFTSELMCTANFDPDQTRFILDPDYVDHILIGDDNFDYHKEYLTKKAFRQEAYKKNCKLLIKTWHIVKGPEWIASLKPGDEFWAGNTMDQMTVDKYVVLRGVTDKTPLEIEVTHKNYGSIYLDLEWFRCRKVTNKQPFPMEDPLCGQAK